MQTSSSEVGQQAVGRTWRNMTLTATYMEPDEVRQQPTGSLYIQGCFRLLLPHKERNKAINIIAIIQEECFLDMMTRKTLIYTLKFTLIITD